MQARHEIDAERYRQIQKGFTPHHDDTLTDGSLVLCAQQILERCSVSDDQGWTTDRAKHIEQKHPVRQRLIIAAAMLVAEVERMDRASTPTPRDPEKVRQTFFIDIGDGDWLIGDEDDLDSVEVALRHTLRPVLDEMLTSAESVRDIQLSMQPMTLAQVDELPDV